MPRGIIDRYPILSPNLPPSGLAIKWIASWTAKNVPAIPMLKPALRASSGKNVRTEYSEMNIVPSNAPATHTVEVRLPDIIEVITCRIIGVVVRWLDLLFSGRKIIGRNAKMLTIPITVNTDAGVVTRSIHPATAGPTI